MKNMITDIMPTNELSALMSMFAGQDIGKKAIEKVRHNVIEMATYYEQEEEMFNELVNGRPYTPLTTELEIQKCYIELALLDREHTEKMKDEERKT